MRRSALVLLSGLVAAVAAPGIASTGAKARFTAAIAARPAVSGIFLATLDGNSIGWRLSVHGLAGPLAVQFLAGREGATLATLCSSCKPTARGTASLRPSAVKALRRGGVYLYVSRLRVSSPRVRARVVLGAPTLEILTPSDGDTIKLPAEISYRVSGFGVGDPPLGHIEVTAAGSSTSVEISPNGQSGTATLPDVKSAFLPGRRDVTFTLATADRTPLPNTEARVVVHDLTIEGRR